MAAVIYYFNAHHASIKWESNPGNMVDGTESNLASTNNDNEVQLLNGNTCPGNNLGDISKVEIQAYGYAQWDMAHPSIDLRPVFAGGNGNVHDSGLPSAPFPGSEDWGDWIDITTDTHAPSHWTWSAVDGLDCDVIYNHEQYGNGHVGEVQIRVTYTPTPPPPAVLRPTVAVGNPLIFQVLSTFGTPMYRRNPRLRY